VDDCGKGPGNLDSSHFKISNLKIKGSVVQGPTPRSCSQSSMTTPLVNATIGSRGCGWVNNCGAGGCSDCKDDGSPGYKACCGSAPGPSPSPACAWVSRCGAGGCSDCKDDGSAGYKACCGSGPGPSPGPSPSPGPAAEWCPSQNDFQIDGASWNGNGWTMTGGGGVHGKQTFNLLGGYIEFDIDTTAAHGGVNNNFYLVSPDPSYFKASNDCDIQAQGKPACMEMDIIENNGNCLAQTTWHTWPNHNGDCDQGGCWGQKYRHGVTKVRAEFTQDGWMTVLMDGAKVDVSHPVPSSSAHKYVHDTMASKGAQIQSSQWVGWVPSGNCGSGDLGSSTFSIRNLKVSGSVVQGPEPSRCGAEEAARDVSIII